MSMSAVTPLIIGIIQNLQTSPIPQTSFLPWTFFTASCEMMEHKEKQNELFRK